MKTIVVRPVELLPLSVPVYLNVSRKLKDNEIFCYSLIPAYIRLYVSTFVSDKGYL